MEKEGQGVMPQENISYDPAIKNAQIDMNPPQVVEPLTGSSVIIDTTAKIAVPNNGFPAGYGPNAHMKKIEKPKETNSFLHPYKCGEGCFPRKGPISSPSISEQGRAPRCSVGCLG